MGNPFLLLIEENPDDVYLTLRELRRVEPDVSVRVINDSAEALTYLEESTELPSALLLGLKFIRLSGVELLHKIRSLERTHLVPVVMLTAGKEENERLGREVAEAKPVVCVSKPLQGESLVSALGTLGLPGIAAASG